MTVTIVEIKEALETAIENLRDSFEGFNFIKKNGIELSDLDGIEGLEKIAVIDDELIEFDDFQSKIHRYLFSEDDDVKKSEFDWDNVANYYHEVEEQYKSYQDLKQQIEDNLTGEQKLEDVELYSELDLKVALLNFLESENQIFEINDHGEPLYLLRDELRVKLKDYL